MASLSSLNKFITNYAASVMSKSTEYNPNG